MDKPKYNPPIIITQDKPFVPSAASLRYKTAQRNLHRDNMANKNSLKSTYLRQLKMG